MALFAMAYHENRGVMRMSGLGGITYVSYAVSMSCSEWLIFWLCLIKMAALVRGAFCWISSFLVAA